MASKSEPQDEACETFVLPDIIQSSQACDLGMTPVCFTFTDLAPGSTPSPVESHDSHMITSGQRSTTPYPEGGASVSSHPVCDGLPGPKRSNKSSSLSKESLEGPSISSPSDSSSDSGMKNDFLGTAFCFYRPHNRI